MLAVYAACQLARVPDLSLSDGAKIISRAPEFNQYARLPRMERIRHFKGSMDHTSVGDFTFQYLNAPPAIRKASGT